MVQPIHADITRTRSTKSRTGTPMAQYCQRGSRPIDGAKKAAKYTIATRMETRKIANP